MDEKLCLVYARNRLSRTDRASASNRSRAVAASRSTPLSNSSVDAMFRSFWRTVLDRSISSVNESGSTPFMPAIRCRLSHHDRALQQRLHIPPDQRL